MALMKWKTIMQKANQIILVWNHTLLPKMLNQDTSLQSLGQYVLSVLKGKLLV